MRTITEQITARSTVSIAVAAFSVIFFAACTAAGAHLRIRLPLSPVPVTAQTLFVLLAGALLGRKLGPTSQLLYGLAAATVPGVAAGPLPLTAGYLVGFIFAPYVIGYLIGECRSFNRVILAMAAGSGVIYLCGAAWLAGATGNLQTALIQGVVPFLPGDAVKLLIAAIITTGGRFVQVGRSAA
ncbi:MAG: biotin transporter BioY [Candidatus Zipacnadales bacterium]